jgi:type I restriction enzyme S subunit
MAGDAPVRMTIEALIASGAIIAHKDGNYGSSYPRVEEFGTEGVPFLTAKSLREGYVDIDGAPRLGNNRADELTFGFVQTDDVLLSHNATIGRVAVVPQHKGRLLVGTSLTYFRLNPQRLLPRYLAVYFAGAEFQNQLVAVMSHSTRNQVPVTAQRKLHVVVPPLAEQKAIAGVLGALDDKIELNRRMNATLESMARALFQSWFVDFDPVRARLDGRQPVGMDNAIAELFPAHFDHAAEGVAPTGWSLKRWGDIATLEYGKSIRHYRESSGEYRVFGTNGPIGFHDEALCNSEGIVIGRKGAYRGVHYSPSPFFVIDTAFYLKPKATLDLKWAYYELMRFDINSMDSGSAIPSTSRDDFYGIPVIVPPPKIQAAFGEIVGGWYANAFANLHQSRTLASLRDTLLPKLLSGELSVAEASRKADITC